MTEPSRSSVNVAPADHARARAAVRCVQRAGRRYSMADFVHDAFLAHIAEIEQRHNGGRALVPDNDPLEPGRQGG